ncbi:zinc finger protein 384a [Mobula hypostoma]|uniref:zinc finger protein 384a n=1 Tax=Mobula hypostoma TaxID=723540 RepID=UPI002FC36EB7
MEDSHYNNSYFWTPIPAVAGQFENVMFINKIKEQLMEVKAGSQSGGQAFSGGPAPAPGQPTAPGADSKQSAQAQTPVSDNLTLLPLPSTTLMTGLVIAPCSSALTPSSSSSSVPAATTSSPSLAPLAQNPTLSLAAGPAMIVSGLASVSGLEPKPGPPPQTPAPEEEEDGGLAKAGGPRKRRGRLGEGVLGEARDPYAVPNDEEASKDGKSYRCRICPLTFVSKSDMQLHAKSHTEAKPHHCPHCSKSFANSSYLAQHVRIHSGAKPYTCSFCQKTFRQLSHLQQHTRIHTGDRPYKCAQPGCEKSFTQLSNLQSHRRQHNKDKPFKCPHCHRAYTDSPSLQVHLATHTVKHIKAYACNSCRKSYTSETYLMKHMRKHKAPEQATDPFAPPAPNSVAGAAPEPAPCSFDIFKSDAHKEPCLTVSAGALQVDPMGTS